MHALACTLVSFLTVSMKPTKSLSECCARRRHYCCPLSPHGNSAFPFKGQLTPILHHPSWQRNRQNANRYSLRLFVAGQIKRVQASRPRSHARSRLMRCASRPRSASPKVLEPVGRHLGVLDRVLSTCRRPSDSSICCHCRSQTSEARRPCR